MSEERKMILQMVADGRISPEEAELLLQAVDESERSARTAAAEEVREEARSHAGTRGIDNIGPMIERTVNQSLKTVDDVLRSIEVKFDTMGASGRDLRHKIHSRVQRATEREVERAAREAERMAREVEREAREAEREARRAAREAELEARELEREARRAALEAEREARRAMKEAYREVERVIWDFDDDSGERFFKIGAVVDRVSVNKLLNLGEPLAAGEKLVVRNKVGSVTVEQYAGTEVQVTATMTAWGEDEQDAEERAAATKVLLTRKDDALYLETLRPTIVGVGFVNIKRTAVDLHVRVPQGAVLSVANKVGDVKVTGSPDTDWALHSKVGDVEVIVPADAAFEYDARSKLGTVKSDLQGVHQEGSHLAGNVGEGGGRLVMSTKTGDVRLSTRG